MIKGVSYLIGKCCRKFETEGNQVSSVNLIQIDYRFYRYEEILILSTQV